MLFARVPGNRNPRFVFALHKRGVERATTRLSCVYVFPGGRPLAAPRDIIRPRYSRLATPRGDRHLERLDSAEELRCGCDNGEPLMCWCAHARITPASRASFTSVQCPILSCWLALASVPRHTRINIRRPQVDPARHRSHVCEPVATQRGRYPHRSCPMMAIHDDLPVMASGGIEHIVHPAR